MSSGVVHNRITTIAIIPTAVSGWLVTGDPVLAVGAGGGCSFNLVCGPDLDQTGITINESILPKPLRLLWAWIWYPYAFLIPHRSPLSHAPILGTLIRILYLWGWMATTILILDAVVYAAGGDLNLWETAVSWLGTIRLDFVLSWVYGLSVADALHFMEDTRSSNKKRRERKARRD